MVRNFPSQKEGKNVRMMRHTAHTPSDSHFSHKTVLRFSEKIICFKFYMGKTPKLRTEEF